MMYEAPKIGDLGQIAEHVFQKFPPFSPEQDATGPDPLGVGSGAGTGAGNQGSTTGVAASAAGGAGGLAGLGLIGALFAGLASRSSNEPAKKPSEVPTESGRPGEP